MKYKLIFGTLLFILIIIAGSGEKTYFFNLIKEDKNWKIKDIATSP